MKMSLICMVMAIAVIGVVAWGCSHMSKDDPTAASPEVADNATQTAETSLLSDSGEISRPTDAEFEMMMNTMKPLSEETDWNWMSRRTENKDAYAFAKRCIPNPDPNFRLSDSSTRFGHWFLLTFVRSSDDGGEVLDAETQNPTYLVDLSAKKAIGLNDFEAARPIFERHISLIRAIEDAEDEDRVLLIDKMAEIATSIAFHKCNNVSGASLADNPMRAQFSSDGTNTTLIFFISKQTTSTAYERATLTLTPQNISFKTGEHAPE